MHRQARLDASGTLHYVVIRDFERGWIVENEERCPCCESFLVSIFRSFIFFHSKYLFQVLIINTYNH